MNENKLVIVGLIVIGIATLGIYSFTNSDALIAIASAVVGGLVGFICKKPEVIDNTKEEKTDAFVLE